MKKIIVCLFCIAIGFSLLCSPVMAGVQPKVVIKIATLAPKGTQTANLIEQLKQEVAEATANEVGLKVYYGGIQGDAKDVLRKIKFKQLQGAMMASYGLGQIAPEVRVTGLPYVFRNAGEVAYVRSHLSDFMEKAFEDKGYVVLGWYDIGFVYSFSKVPITSVEIARKQKFWAPEGDPLAQTVYQVIGITPVSLSITDVLTSLSTRLIDAASAPPFAAVAFRWYKSFQYMTEYPSTSVLGAMVVTKSVYDKISPDSQKKLKEISQKYCKKIEDGHRASNIKSIELLKKAGITIVRVENVEGHKLFIEDTAHRTKEALVGKLFTRELLDRTMALLKEYRDQHPDSKVDRIPE